MRVQPGNTLALVGRDVSIDGGILAAPSGRIEVGSVGVGQVGLRATAQGYALDYAAVPTLQNIRMSQRSLLDVGWLFDQSRSAGSIQVQGNHIRLSDGSVLLSQNRGLRPAGDLTVQATGLLELLGTSPDEKIMSGIVSETSGLGASSNLNVTAKGLVLQNGGILQSRTFSLAPSGSVNINATDFIEMSGTSPRTNVFNAIGSTTFFTSLLINPFAPPVTTGKAGDVNVSTRRLSMRDGSTIVALSFGDASAGRITVNSEHMELIGSANNTPEPIGDMPTSLLSIGYLRGNSGTISLNTHTLNLVNGGTISTTNLGAADSGKITVNASESIQMSSQTLVSDEGIVLGFSNISSTIGTLTYNRQLLAPSNIVSGNAGDIIINTPSLRVDLAGIGVGNYGTGSAGTININADSARLNNGGIISATTFSGEGGNINLQARTLVLRNQAGILTEAGGAGSGGNIEISAPIILGLGNSDIIANAVQGRGGNIQITTQSILGLAFRNLLDPRSASTNDITASSQFSTNGTVEINTPGIDPNSGLVELPVDLVDSQQLAQGCTAAQGSSFVITGRGGVPQNPMQQVNGDRTWSDLRDFSNSKGSTVLSQPPALVESIVEATTWQRNPAGEVELIAAQPIQPEAIATCAPAQ